MIPYSRPFVRQGFSHNQTQLHSTDFLANDCNFYSLGILLLELCFGCRLEDYRLRKTRPATTDPAAKQALDVVAALKWSDSVSDEGGADYAKAVKWCFMGVTDREKNWRGEIIRNVGSGVGRATALAFAQAGAKHVVLVGRTSATLEETAAAIRDISDKITISIFAASVADEQAVQNIAREVGAWDVLILNAAHLSPPNTVLNIPLSDFWTSYETNVKSVYIFAQALLPLANANATFLSVNAAGAVLPAEIGAGLTGYMSSKIAQAKLMEYIAHEHPELFVASVHPGVIDTKMLKEAELQASKLPQDTVELPAHFMLWLSGTQQRKYLSGKMLWANWDVEELTAKAEEFAKEGFFTMGMTGWPFAKSGLFGQTGSVR
ncbi:hypothetical protein SLS60_011620 [Paraconiothyrium brasiliense]|uniref:NAD(P)-binding protein n=1 Tax=Paraconiothyrium brasiliense TaxID=300254 RepID=A0ABR3QIR8_9PLEO